METALEGVRMSFVYTGFGRPVAVEVDGPDEAVVAVFAEWGRPRVYLRQSLELFYEELSVALSAGES